MTTNKSHVDKRDAARDPNSSPDVIAEEFSLMPLLQALWGYRLTILLSIATVVVGFSFWATGVYFSQPIERHANLGFRLIFDGASDGVYPNGTNFSTGEIIGTPVLTTVYDVNGLERYLTYEQFRDALFVMNSGGGVNMLDLEYQSKLAATGLTAVERGVLEAEYNQKREALRVAQFRLNFVLSEEITLSIPEVLLSKALNDVLVEWAEQMATRRGVLGYETSASNITMLSREALAVEDYAVQVDFLRGELHRLTASVDAMAALPGAGTLRIRERNMSLSDIRSSLEDLLRYRIEPTMTLILENGIVLDSSNTAATYFSTRRFQVGLEQQEARGLRSALEGSLRVYNTGRGTSADGLDVEGSGEASSFGSSFGAAGATVIPQLDDSFIDRVISMSGEEQDMAFRQSLITRIINARRQEVRLERELSYYDRVNGFFSGAGRASWEGSTGQEVVRSDPEQVGWVEALISEVFDGIVSVRKQSTDFTTELAIQNLNPSGLFTITDSFNSIAVRGLTLQTIGSYGLFVLLFCFLVAPLCCLVHYYLRQANWS